MRKEIMVVFSGDVHALHTEPLTNYIIEHKPKYLFLWNAIENKTPQFDEYINWDYNTYSEHSDKIKKLEQALKDCDTMLYIVVCAHPDCSTYKNIKTNPIKNLKFLLWPTSLIHYTYYILKACFDDITNLKVSDKIEKLYINYNNKGRLHRCKLMDELARNELLDLGLNSWHSIVNDYKFSYWEQNVMKLDDFNLDDLASIYSENLLNKKAFISIIGESEFVFDTIFLTEKTFRTILIEQPFYIYGSKGANKSLELFGFKTYDNIFDYSYENELDWEHRIMGPINNLNNIKDKNLYELKDSVKDIIKHNKNRCIEIVNKDIYIPKEILDFYTNYGENFLQLINWANDMHKAHYPFVGDIKYLNEAIKKAI